MFKSFFLEMRSFDRFSCIGTFFSNVLVESLKIHKTTMLSVTVLKRSIGLEETLVLLCGELISDGVVALEVMSMGWIWLG